MGTFSFFVHIYFMDKTHRKKHPEVGCGILDGTPLSENTIDEAVKPELRKDFYEDYDKWFPTPACEKHKRDFVTTKVNGENWTPSQCCLDSFKFQKRTPGLFKEEFRGEGIISLCSKTYIAWGDEGDKISCKGLQKKRNLENLTKQKYLNVLETQTAGKGTNKGFRVNAGKIFTYEQEKFGLSYLYAKREILEDGVSTKPLKL